MKTGNILKVPELMKSSSGLSLPDRFFQEPFYNPGMGEFLQDLVKFEGTSTVLMREALPEQIGMRFGDLFKNLYKAGNEILLGLSRNSKVYDQSRF